MPILDLTGVAFGFVVPFVLGAGLFSFGLAETEFLAMPNLEAATAAVVGRLSPEDGPFNLLLPDLLPSNGDVSAPMPIFPVTTPGLFD